MRSRRATSCLKDAMVPSRDPTRWTMTVGAQPFGVAITPCRLNAAVQPDGRTLTITGSPFTPSATLTLSIASTPQALGTVTTSPTGTFSQSFTLPCSVDAGAHTITATGPNGSSATASVTLAPRLTAAFTGGCGTACHELADFGFGARGQSAFGLVRACC
jgi:hypothetical protein